MLAHAVAGLTDIIAAVAGKYLYIDGGEFSYRSGESTIYQFSSNTLSIDLSQDWVNDTVVFHTTSKPSLAPILSSASLWYDKTKGLFYSGVIGSIPYVWLNPPKLPPLSLWSFKPDGRGSGTWKEEIPVGDSVWRSLTRSTLGYQSSGVDTALVLGGEVVNISAPTLQPGLVQFDMRTRKFTNSSATSFNANGTGSGGQMHFVPFFGPNGIFLIMGGRKDMELDDYGNADDFYGFDNIWVYEGATHQWYNQTASGNVPKGRMEFCVAGVNSTDSTYEIFLYGGHQGHLGPVTVPYDEIFILSLPAWHWLKVDYPPQYPRASHSCNAVGGSQVITIGGFDINPNIYFDQLYDVERSILNTTADPFAQGLGIFNMTSLAWEHHYTANAPPYEQSDLVKTFYRENPQDGSQFSTAGLKELFQTTHFTPSADMPASPSHKNSTVAITPAPGNPNSSPSDISLIVGCVVGGVAGLACIVATLLFFRRRNTKRFASTRIKNGSTGVTTSTTTPEMTNAPTRAHYLLQEADAIETQYRGAQLGGQGIQEMQQYPVELMAQDS
ncbi:MAG: hypothetical protein Q9182_003677 [Xanthomendoza sp. 2 TL-2023]